MLTSFRRLPWRTVQPRVLSSYHRAISVSATRRAEVEDVEASETNSAEEMEESYEENEGEFAEGRFGRNSAEMLETFLDADGSKFKTPLKPNNWLGDTVPFPLNKTFKPPTPVSDERRSRIYQEFMADPKTNSVRMLAGRNHLSMQRVDAILRLKGLEEHWKKNKPLQTGFLAGMEWCLGVTHHAKVTEARGKELEGEQHPRYDVREADTLMEAEGNDPARLRYRKMFWEAIPDGKDPVVPLLLEKARKDGIRHAREEEDSKNDPRFLPPQPKASNADKVKMVAPPGRPMIKFVDVGGKFLDKAESLKRMKRRNHRGTLKARKRDEKESSRSEERTARRDAIEADLAVKAAAKAAAKAKPVWQQGTGGRDLVM